MVPHLLRDWYVLSWEKDIPRTRRIEVMLRDRTFMTAVIVLPPTIRFPDGGTRWTEWINGVHRHLEQKTGRPLL